MFPGGKGRALDIIVQHLLDLVFGRPRLCCICQRPLGLGETRICASCLKRIPLVQAPICSKCGKPLRGRDAGDGVCFDCRKERRFFTKARSLGLYTGGLRSYIHDLKYRRQRRVALALGHLMGRLAAKESGFWNCDGIVPVPLYPSRLRQRGFNQAGLLAQPVAYHLGVPVWTDACIRLRATVRQSSLTPRQRVENIKGVFSVRLPGLITAKRVLIVDDILTTGATVNELSRCLLRAGAVCVFVLTAAVGVRDRDLTVTQ